MKNAPSRNTRQAINLAELIDDMEEEELIILLLIASTCYNANEPGKAWKTFALGM